MSGDILKFPSKDAKTSLDTYLENITKDITEKKVSSLITIVYMEGEEEPSFYVAGAYPGIREILGDLRLMEQVVIDEL